MNTVQEVLIQIWNWLKGPVLYNNTFSLFNQTGSINPGNCAEMTFVNQGTSNVTINGVYTLANKEFLAFDGKKYERDTSVYNVTFDNTGTNQLVVIRKFYNV